MRGDIRTVVAACCSWLSLAAVSAGGVFSLDGLLLPSGTTPNGTAWSSLVSGANPVAFFNLATGELQLDPKGRPISGFSFRYGSAVTSGTTNGPFVFPAGSGSVAVGATFPAGSYPFAPTTTKAQIGAALYTLATSGANSASTGGFFDLPWSFNVVAPTATGGAPWTAALVTASNSGQGFRAATNNLMAGFSADLLGFGPGIGLFDYTVDGQSGRGLGAVIPVTAVPEPSSIIAVMAGAVVVACYTRRRRTSKTVVAA